MTRSDDDGGEPELLAVTDAVHDDELVQLNVRVRRSLQMDLKLLAERDGRSLARYIAEQLDEVVRRDQAELQRTYAEAAERAKRDYERYKQKLAQLGRPAAMTRQEQVARKRRGAAVG